jgi:NTE family protein
MSDNKMIDEKSEFDAQGQPIEYIAFSGGGAKGAGYSGVNSALIDSGIIKGIKAVAGSSAGSIAAAVIASGISKEDYYTLSKNTNMKNLLGDSKYGPILKDGKPLHDLIAKTIKDNILKYLDNIEISDLVDNRITQIYEQLEFDKDNIEIQETLKKLEEIKNDSYKAFTNLEEKSKRGASKITFKDLDLLRMLDPEKFKGLIITATKKETGSLVIFDAKHSPDVEIADACRASSSFPIIFKPHKINGEEYIDGGYRDNIPIKYFDGEELNQTEQITAENITNNPSKIKQAKQEKRTMAFAFGSDDMNDTINVAIYSSKEKITSFSGIMKFLMDVVLKSILGLGGNFKYTKEEEKLYQGVRENALNTVVIGTGDVSTLSFDKAQERVEYLNLKSYIQTMEHIDNHELGGYVDENLAMKSLIIGVYEDIYKQSPQTLVKNQFVQGYEKKLNDILDFARDDSWKDKQPEEVLTNLIIKASIKRTNGEFSAETRTMGKFIDKLNDPQTQTKIKTQFMSLLKIDPQENPIKFKFEAKHFDNFLSQEKNRKNLDRKGSNFTDKMINNKLSEMNKKSEIV